jgi:hypothetical protein
MAKKPEKPEVDQFAYVPIIRCSTAGIGPGFLVCPGRLIGICARRVHCYHCRQHRWIDYSCNGTTAGTLNSMGWVAALIYLFGAAGSGYFMMSPSAQLSLR